MVIAIEFLKKTLKCLLFQRQKTGLRSVNSQIRFNKLFFSFPKTNVCLGCI